MLCWSINVVKWKIRQGRGVRNGNTLAKIGPLPSLSVSKLPRMLFLPSLYIWTPPAKNFNPTRRNRRVSPSPQSFQSCQRAHLFNDFTENFHRKGKKKKMTGLEISSLAASPSWFAAHVGIIAMAWRKNRKRDHQTSQNVTPTDWTEEEGEEEESLDWARGTWCAHRVSILIRLRWDCKGFAATTANETCGAVAAKNQAWLMLGCDLHKPPTFRLLAPRWEDTTRVKTRKSTSPPKKDQSCLNLPFDSSFCRALRQAESVKSPLCSKKKKSFRSALLL